MWLMGRYCIFLIGGSGPTTDTVLPSDDVFPYYFILGREIDGNLRLAIIEISTGDRALTREDKANHERDYHSEL